jgi:hypothetical protein
MRRNIPDRLFEIFENRLAHSNQAANCIINNDARGLLVEAARAMIHLQETDGENRSAEIDMMHRVTGVGMGEPWCMSFVQSCLAYVERRVGVASPLTLSAACVTVWNSSPKEMRVKSIPLAGAIVIWKNVDNPNRGHTGFVMDCDGTSLKTIEGNTSPSNDPNSAVDSDGDGVFMCHRRWDLFNPDSNRKILLGALKPF